MYTANHIKWKERTARPAVSRERELSRPCSRSLPPATTFQIVYFHRIKVGSLAGSPGREAKIVSSSVPIRNVVLVHGAATG
jgi:hypothetical protein